jgi:hypothetical protein
VSGQATISLGSDALLFEPDELDRLVRSLRQLQSPVAASVAEDLSAQRLTGTIQLCPTGPELEALACAIERLRGLMHEPSALRQLLVLAHDRRPQPPAAVRRSKAPDKQGAPGR